MAHPYSCVQVLRNFSNSAQYGTLLNNSLLKINTFKISEERRQDTASKHRIG
jgi:hypothetical protein